MPVSLCTLLAIKYLQHKSFCVCMTVHACMILKLRFVMLMQSEATKLYRNSASNIRDHITNNFAMSSYIATKTVHTKKLCI